FSPPLLRLPTSPLFPYTTLFRSLLRKPAAVLNSPLQHSLPEPLLTLVLQADTGERRRLLRVLEQATQIAGFEKAVSVMNQITSSDRKSTRLNSSHVKISYAVFCL